MTVQKFVSILGLFSILRKSYICTKARAKVHLGLYFSLYDLFSLSISTQHSFSLAHIDFYQLFWQILDFFLKNFFDFFQKTYTTRAMTHRSPFFDHKLWEGSARDLASWDRCGDKNIPQRGDSSWERCVIYSKLLFLLLFLSPFRCTRYRPPHRVSTI